MMYLKRGYKVQLETQEVRFSSPRLTFKQTRHASKTAWSWQCIVLRLATGVLLFSYDPCTQLIGALCILWRMYVRISQQLKLNRHVC